jgi:hypothetical protein
VFGDQLLDRRAVVGSLAISMLSASIHTFRGITPPLPYSLPHRAAAHPGRRSGRR